VAFAINTYVKRNVVISDRYDQLSLLRTIGLSLGLPPLNLNDAQAMSMFNIFTLKPDFRPPSVINPLIRLSNSDRELYQQMAEAIDKD
jgi:hypothetical protein